MSNINGTTVVAYPRLRLVVGGRERAEEPDQGSRFTPLRSLEARTFLRRRCDKGRTFSAICFPGWDRG
jgi:hypothetical protein